MRLSRRHPAREARREARAARHAGGGADASRAGAVVRRCRGQAGRSREDPGPVPEEEAMTMKGPLVLLFAAAAAGAAPEVSRSAQGASSPASDAAQAGPSARERARRLFDEALLALTTAQKLSSPDTDVIERFRAAAEAARDSVPALLDYAA